MDENRFFIRGSDMQGFAPARIGGKAAILSYGPLIAHIKRTAGPEAAALFAEPQLPRGSTGETGTISWYAARQGTVAAIDTIDEGARRQIAQKLADRLKMLAKALADDALGPAVASWLNIGGNGDILSVGGEPVLVNWGAVPATVVTREQRAEHYANTLGRFAPQLPIPTGEVGPLELNRPAMTATTVAGASAIGAQATAASSAAPSPQLAREGRPAAISGVIAAPAAATAAAVAASQPTADAAGSLPPPAPARASRAPWIAAGIAAASLLLLSLPGVLIYPAQPIDTSARDAFEEQRLRASNESLEAQLRSLQGALGSNQCRPANFVLPVPGLPPGPLNPDGQVPPGQSSAGPGPQLQITPQTPDQAQLPPTERRGREDVATVGRLLEKSTLLIIGLKSADGRISVSQGSGFLVSNRHVVTNHHVVQGVDPNRVFVANKTMGTVAQARVVALSQPPPVETDVGIDIAVLEIEPLQGYSGLKLGPTPAKLSTAYVAGYPGFLTERDSAFQSFLQTLARGASNRDDIRQSMTQGRIEVPGVDLEEGRINNSMRTGSRALPVLLHDMQLAKGNSGGPLVDACGRVIGINTMLFPSDAGTRQGNVAQDVATLRNFLAEKGISVVSEEQVCAPTPPPAATVPPALAPPPAAAAAAPKPAAAQP